jgi:catalase
MSQGPSGKAHQRFLNAKGIIVQGSFQPSPDAGSISRASHLQGGIVPVTVCFSDGALDSNVADTIAATSIVADSAAAERKLAFDPTDLIDGIELSDDPLPELRSRAYVYSVAGRHAR